MDLTPKTNKVAERTFACPVGLSTTEQVKNYLNQDPAVIEWVGLYCQEYGFLTPENQEGILVNFSKLPGEESVKISLIWLR